MLQKQRRPARFQHAADFAQHRRLFGDRAQREGRDHRIERSARERHRFADTFAAIRLDPALRRRRDAHREQFRSEEHTSELQSLMRNSYAVFRLTTKITYANTKTIL